MVVNMLTHSHFPLQLPLDALKNFLYQLLILLLGVLKILCQISAAHSMGPSTGAWGTYHWERLQKSLSPSPKNYQLPTDLQ